MIMMRMMMMMRRRTSRMLLSSQHHLHSVGEKVAAVCDDVYEDEPMMDATNRTRLSLLSSCNSSRR